ncbi:MAG: hypothetical protein ACRDRY_06035 [Pseudonocardiaceae bacterium]
MGAADLYQLLPHGDVDTVQTRPATNPDRASFTTALQAARDQLIAAAGICPDSQADAHDEPVDRLGVNGRAVLATLLPARRARYSARKVKCATSRYLNRDGRSPRHRRPSPQSTSSFTTPRPDASSSRCPEPTPRSPPADSPRPGHRAARQRPPPRLDQRRNSSQGAATLGRTDGGAERGRRGAGGC